jgi:hypothetical protein
MSDTGTIVAFPVQKQEVKMTKEQRSWYWAGRIDSVIEAMGHVPTFQSSAGKRPGAPRGRAEVIKLPRRKPKPAELR